MKILVVLFALATAGEGNDDVVPLEASPPPSPVLHEYDSWDLENGILRLLREGPPKEPRDTAVCPTPSNWWKEWQLEEEETPAKEDEMSTMLGWLGGDRPGTLAWAPVAMWNEGSSEASFRVGR